MLVPVYHCIWHHIPGYHNLEIVVLPPTCCNFHYRRAEVRTKIHYAELYSNCDFWWAFADNSSTIILIWNINVDQCPVEWAVWRTFRKLWLNSSFSRVAAAQFACQLMWQEQGDINNIIFHSSVRLSICMSPTRFSSITGAASDVQLSHSAAKRRRIKRI
jgi:hypothetical protein